MGRFDYLSPESLNGPNLPEGYIVINDIDPRGQTYAEILFQSEDLLDPYNIEIFATSLRNLSQTPNNGNSQGDYFLLLSEFLSSIESNNLSDAISDWADINNQKLVICIKSPAQNGILPKETYLNTSRFIFGINTTAPQTLNVENPILPPSEFIEVPKIWMYSMKLHEIIDKNKNQYGNGINRSEEITQLLQEINSVSDFILLCAYNNINTIKPIEILEKTFYKFGDSKKAIEKIKTHIRRINEIFNTNKTPHSWNQENYLQALQYLKANGINMSHYETIWAYIQGDINYYFKNALESHLSKPAPKQDKNKKVKKMKTNPVKKTEVEEAEELENLSNYYIVSNVSVSAIWNYWFIDPKDSSQSLVSIHSNGGK